MDAEVTSVVAAELSPPCALEVRHCVQPPALAAIEHWIARCRSYTCSRTCPARHQSASLHATARQVSGSPHRTDQHPRVEYGNEGPTLCQRVVSSVQMHAECRWLARLQMRRVCLQHGAHLKETHKAKKRTTRQSVLRMSCLHPKHCSTSSRRSIPPDGVRSGPAPLAAALLSLRVPRLRQPCRHSSALLRPAHCWPVHTHAVDGIGSA